MQSITETFRPRVYEYNKFMKFFKKRYPDIYAMYFRMIEQPLGQRADVSISGLNTIKPSARAILHYIIAEYYRPLYN